MSAVAMTIRIASAVLTLAGLLALLSGLLFWSGSASNLIALHMLLGFLTVAALWTIGFAQALAPSGWRMALAIAILGALTLLLGLYQTRLVAGPYHSTVRIIHLLLGLAAIGVGHMAAARQRKAAARQRKAAARQRKAPAHDS
jgi:uncharacterized membrane protein YuzA (DUF378 family)